MKISLRKAHALQKELLNEVRKLEFETEVEINEFEQPEKKILDAADVFVDRLDKRKDLLDTLFVLRKAVAKANNAVDVDTILADVARRDNDIGFLNRIIDEAEPRVHGDVIKGKLGKIMARDESESRIYGRSTDTVVTHIFNDEELKAFELKLAEAKKEKQKLQDRLLELNFKTEVEIAEHDEAVLTAANLI